MAPFIIIYGMASMVFVTMLALGVPTWRSFALAVAGGCISYVAFGYSATSDTGAALTAFFGALLGAPLAFALAGLVEVRMHAVRRKRGSRQGEDAD